MTDVILETERLIVRRANTDDGDVNMFYRLWNDPRVMTMVGFLQGLGITHEKI